MSLRTRSCCSLLALLVGTAITAACDGGGGEGVLSDEGVGAVTGLVFRDVDGNRSFSEGDKRVARTPIRLQPWGSTTTIAVTQTDDSGVFRFPRIPVGSYRAVVDPAVTGDSLVVAARMGDEVTITEGITVTADIALVRR